MSDPNEILKDITREMREAANSSELFGGEEVGEPLVRGLRVYDWADRLDAAAKRERETADLRAIHRCNDGERENPGNAAAMREALVTAIQAAEEGLALFHEAASCATLTNGSAYPEEKDKAEIVDAIAKCRAALATPARNCDRFASAVTAYHAYSKETHSGMCDPAFVLAHWLFAPAEEGGAK